MSLWDGTAIADPLQFQTVADDDIISVRGPTGPSKGTAPADPLPFVKTYWIPHSRPTSPGGDFPSAPAAWAASLASRFASDRLLK